MKIQHLRFFAAVVECGGVTQAAERLHVSQPAISAGIKALEHELGESLFERSGGRRRMVATPKALRFHERALDILKRCETARVSFRSRESQALIVRIGVMSTIAAEAVAAVFARLSQATEHRWQMRDGRPNDLVQWLRQGRIDLAWTTVDANTPNAQVLWREPFVVLAARDHRLARPRGRRVTLKDLDGEPLVLRGSCELKAGQLQSAGIKMRVTARTDRDDLALRLVADGIGVAIAPRSLSTRDVVAVPIADLDLARSIGLRWSAGLSEVAVSAVRNAVSMCRQLGT